MSSSYLNDPEILREIIMDHYKYPHNHKLIKDGYLSAHMASASCIDDITVNAKIQDGVIEDICFDGVACTISTASTSIMTDLVKGLAVEDAKKIMDQYFSMVNGDDYDEDMLEEAVCMKSVYKQANRIKCATIGWNALKQLIEESEDNHE